MIRREQKQPTYSIDNVLDLIVSLSLLFLDFLRVEQHLNVKHELSWILAKPELPKSVAPAVLVVQPLRRIGVAAATGVAAIVFHPSAAVSAHLHEWTLVVEEVSTDDDLLHNDREYFFSFAV